MVTFPIASPPSYEWQRPAFPTSRCSWPSRTADWLDGPTSEVLAFIARRIESDPVIMLAAVRSGYPSALLDAGLPELQLAGLDNEAAGALLDAAAPQLPLSVRAGVLREAAGNPLAFLELPAVPAGMTMGNE